MEIRVPDIGDFKNVAVIELLAQAGDTIRAEQSLLTLESDKASIEIPSPAAGVLKSLSVKLGDKVSQGDVIGWMEPAGATVPSPAVAPAASGAPVSAAPAPAAPAPAPVASPAPVPASVATPAPPAASDRPPHASPSVRKFARELGVPLAQVSGTGTKGRITERDVQAYVQQALAARAGAPAAAPSPAGGAFPGLLAWPQVDFAKFGSVERKALSRIKKISGANLHRNWVVIPHVTNHDEADITELELFRVQMNKEHEKSGVKFTMLAFLIKACVAALKKFPEFNASLDGDEL
ncbi:biotin/lipoyl-containing protein, partial [Inhella gelatinilytica]